MNLPSNQMQPTTSVLILGNYRATLPLAETLAKRGYNVIVTTGCGRGTAQFSRFVSEFWDNPPLKSRQQFYTELAKLLRSRPDISIVLPIWEECLLGVHEYSDILPYDRLYACTSKELIETCLNKSEMLIRAEKAGVPNAEFKVVTDYNGLKSAARDVGFPLVIRSNSSEKLFHNSKIITLHSNTDLNHRVPSWPEDHDELIVQKQVVGSRINVYFAAKNGEIIRLLGAKITDTDKEDGSGLAVDGCTITIPDELTRYCSKLIQELDYHGVGTLQFLQDHQSGKFSFLELNPRIAGNHAVPEDCGLGLGGLALDLAAGAPVSSTLVMGEVGKRYVWVTGKFSKSLRGSLNQYSLRSISPVRTIRAVGGIISADIFLDLRPGDPMPFLALIFRRIPGLRLVLNRLSKRKVRAETVHPVRPLQIEKAA